MTPYETTIALTRAGSGTLKEPAISRRPRARDPYLHRADLRRDDSPPALLNAIHIDTFRRMHLFAPALQPERRPPPSAPIRMSFSNHAAFMGFLRHACIGIADANGFRIKIPILFALRREAVLFS